VFKLSGYSPLAKNRTIERKKSWFQDYGVQVRGFIRVLLVHPKEGQEVFRFTLGQQRIEKHTGHELTRRDYHLLLLSRAIVGVAPLYFVALL